MKKVRSGMYKKGVTTGMECIRRMLLLEWVYMS